MVPLKLMVWTALTPAVPESAAEATLAWTRAKLKVVAVIAVIWYVPSKKAWGNDNPEMVTNSPARKPCGAAVVMVATLLARKTLVIVAGTLLVVVTMLIDGLSPVRLLLATVSVGCTPPPMPFWKVIVVVGTPTSWTGPVHCDEPLTTRRAPYTVAGV